MKRIITNAVTGIGCILFVITIGRAARHIISSGDETPNTVSAKKTTSPANVPGVDMAMVKKVLGDAGTGKNDALLCINGERVRHDCKPAVAHKPKISRHTWTDERNDVKYWNTYVANIEAGEQEQFYNELLNEVQKYPVAMGN